SRTIWLAAVLATAGIIARDGVALLVRHRRTGLALAASLPVVMAIAAVTGLLSSVASRVTTLSTLGARGEIWKASLQLWSLDPLTGSGPGTFALALPSTGYFAANTFAPRHADNALIQALAEGGLLVAVGAILLVWVAMWTAWRRGHRSTLWILIFVVFASITDNPTDTAGLVAATTFWLVVGLPYTPPATSSRFQARTRPHWVTVAATALLVPVASVQIAFGTANFFHHAALAAASDGRWERSEHMVELALVLDPENALYLRELGVLRLTRGDVAAAAQPLTRAASLAPTDEVTQRAYVHAMLELGRPDLAEDALSRAASVHRASTTMLLYEAWFHAASNEGQARSSAAHAVLLSPLIAASPAWEMHGFPSAAESVSVAYGLLRSSPAPPFRLSSQPMWLAALNGVPPTQTDVDGASSVSLIGTSRAFTALLGCRLDDAQRIIVDYQEVEAEQGLYWFVRSLIERATGTDPSTSQQLAMLLEPVRYGAVFWGEVGESPFIGDSQDRGLYHQSSISAHPPALTLPATTDGLRAWMVDPQGTAQRVAPEVNLARCRL
ncbi:MAG TPA: O-antigen ligase family protein, partial [Gemmatimonadales bacterium]|nr:O-antigen ligase family protein [Gemmatimonadales bacterium]